MKDQGVSSAIFVREDLIYRQAWMNTLSQFMKESSLSSLFLKDQGVSSAIFVRKDLVCRQAWMNTLFLFMSNCDPIWTKRIGPISIKSVPKLESGWAKIEIKP